MHNYKKAGPDDAAGPGLAGWWLWDPPTAKKHQPQHLSYICRHLSTTHDFFL